MPHARTLIVHVALAFGYDQGVTGWRSLSGGIRHESCFRESIWAR